MKTLTLTDEEYLALNALLDYVIENEQEDYEELLSEAGDGPATQNHVYNFASIVADAVDQQAEEQPPDEPVRDDDWGV